MASARPSAVDPSRPLLPRGSLGPALALTILAAWASASSAQEPSVPIAGEPFFFALSVADVEASSAWYARVLGFEEVRSVDLPERGTRLRILRRSGALLELVEVEAATPAGGLDPPIERRFLLHGVFKVGFRVESLDRTVERLTELDVALRGEIVTESDGTMRSLQIEDPDGNVVQIFELL